MELKRLQRQKRGQVSAAEIKRYEETSVNELSSLLNSAQPKKRTIAATLIGNKKILEFIPQLCQSILYEKSLYPRIAISRALGKMGEPAVVPLISLLGKIGSNQEKELPQKYFAKKSFPLARDLSARTLVKIGTPAIPYLIAKLTTGTPFEIQQALDAIGGIVSRTGNHRPLPVLLQILTADTTDVITTWKIVRTLSAFRSPAVIEPLLKMLTNDQPPLRWEAARSLGQVGISTPEVVKALQNGFDDEDSEVRKAAKIALDSIHH